MIDESDTPEPVLGSKGPAPVTQASRAKKTPARTTVAKKAAAKKAPAKKAAAKKAPAKKAAAKKAPATKSPVKRAPAKKAAAKKAPATKSPVKRAPAKKAAAKKAPAKTAAAEKSPGATPPAPTPPPAESRRRVTRADDLPPTPPLLSVPTGPDAEGTGSATTQQAPRTERWAICASITEDMLNDLMLFVVGGGVALEPLDTNVALPAMGDVGVRLALTVTGASFDLRADDAGRVRIVVTADGDVSTRAADYDGDTTDAGIGTGAPTVGGMAMPTPPAPIPVRVEALVQPFIELRADHTVSLGLDVRSAELVSLQTDPDAPVPDGVDPAAWSGILSMFGMLFGALGDGLFESLGEHVGSVGRDLDPQVGSILAELGVAVGHADISVSSGLLSIGLPATAAVEGRAQPVPIAGKRVGLGLAASVVDSVAHRLVLQAIGDVPLPFELDVDLGEQFVGGRLRNARVLPSSFPDLRSSLRTQVRTRLLRGRLELSVQAAWVELPSALPSIFNQVSRRLGELVSLAPIRVRFPARVGLPVIPDSTDTIPVEVDDLRVTRDGVGLVVSLA